MPIELIKAFAIQKASAISNVAIGKLEKIGEKIMMLAIELLMGN